MFDSGVFRPLEPVELAEGTQVHVRVPKMSHDSLPELPAEELAEQRTAIEEMLCEIERLPIEEPDDSFSGREHDEILYGAESSLSTQVRGMLSIRLEMSIIQLRRRQLDRPVSH